MATEQYSEKLIDDDDFALMERNQNNGDHINKDDIVSAIELIQRISNSDPNVDNFRNDKFRGSELKQYTKFVYLLFKDPNVNQYFDFQEFIRILEVTANLNIEGARAEIENKNPKYQNKRLICHFLRHAGHNLEWLYQKTDDVKYINQGFDTLDTAMNYAENEESGYLFDLYFEVAKAYLGKVKYFELIRIGAPITDSLIFLQRKKADEGLTEYEELEYSAKNQEYKEFLEGFDWELIIPNVSNILERSKNAFESFLRLDLKEVTVERLSKLDRLAVMIDNITAIVSSVPSWTGTDQLRVINNFDRFFLYSIAANIRSTAIRPVVLKVLEKRHSTLAIDDKSIIRQHSEEIVNWINGLHYTAITFKPKTKEDNQMVYGAKNLSGDIRSVYSHYLNPQIKLYTQLCTFFKLDKSKFQEENEIIEVIINKLKNVGSKPKASKSKKKRK